MDRTVIVLTPSEWENKVELGKGLDTAYQHLHYAATREAIVNAMLHGLKRDLEHNRPKEEMLEEIEAALTSASDITREVREAQRIINSVATVISYKLKTESDERVKHEAASGTRPVYKG
jgi:hypothetical protein